MRFLREKIDQIAPHFEKGGKLEILYPFFEAADTFFYATGDTAKGSVHVRDGINLKRMMTFVMMALIPCILVGMHNVGFTIHKAVSAGATVANWRVDALVAMGLPLDPSNIISNLSHGLLYFLPLYIISAMTCIFWEVLFGIIRKHEVSEGVFVTMLLFPLIVPPSLPWWQAVVALSFAVILGKEVFGGTGMNFMNPALVARAFLFFAFPAAISGDKPWIPVVDGFSGATPLGLISAGEASDIVSSSMFTQVLQSGGEYFNFSFFDAFMGFVPGSVGETSTLACILAGIFLIVTGVASWRIIVSLIAGTVVTAFLFNAIGSDTNVMFSVTPMWHMVLGGFAFGAVFMATDPVTGAQTLKGQYYYGALIGILVVLIRVVNSAYPEGMMLAILVGNIFAPLIDNLVIEANIKRRGRQYARR